MQIIFGKQNAEKLRSKYTVLELETFDVEGTPLETYCVVSSESIPMHELSMVEKNTQIHDEFVDAIKQKNYKLCGELYVHLIGKFGGELDSFYEEIIKRI